MRNSIDIASSIIEDFEGFRSKPYKCPAGVWTIGFGTTVYPDKKIVTPVDPPITQEKGREFLKNKIQSEIVPSLEKRIPFWREMGENQRACLISFAYNLGTLFYNGNNFRTISKALSSRENWGNVPSALMLYVNPGSSFEAGLKRRRKAEGDLWLGKSPYLTRKK